MPDTDATDVYNNQTCSVNDHPDVWQWQRNLRESSLSGSKYSFNKFAHRRLAARSLAISCRSKHIHLITTNQRPFSTNATESKNKVNTDIAVRNRNYHTVMGNRMPYGITQCYLPPGRGDFPPFTPAKAGTRFSDPGGMQG